METRAASSAGTTAVPRLRRTLTLWDLIFYGIILIQPIAPCRLWSGAKPSTGTCHHHPHRDVRHVVHRVQHGRMGTTYPTCGIRYTYVGKGMNPRLGFLAGWAWSWITCSSPMINTVWIATACQQAYLHRSPVLWYGP